MGQELVRSRHSRGVTMVTWDNLRGVMEPLGRKVETDCLESIAWTLTFEFREGGSGGVRVCVCVLGINNIFGFIIMEWTGAFLKPLLGLRLRHRLLVLCTQLTLNPYFQRVLHRHQHTEPEPEPKLRIEKSPRARIWEKNPQDCRAGSSECLLNKKSLCIRPESKWEEKNSCFCKACSFPNSTLHSSCRKTLK